MLRWAQCGLLLVLAACAKPTEAGNQSRVVTFGDSNTDGGWQGRTLVANSYINPDSPAPASAPNDPYTLAGMLDARGIPAVNHGISGTQSGRGRIASGAPNALEVVGGVTRFEAEVLGLGYPWDGGGTSRISRVQAFQPGPCDFAYVSIGTNDGHPPVVRGSLRWMMARWAAAGRSPRHFIVTTLAPVTSGPRTDRITKINVLIRRLAVESGVVLIDLERFTSNDDGRTWRDSTLHVDGVHYTDQVRIWIADQISAYVRKRGCNW